MNHQPEDTEKYKGFTIELWADENPSNPRTDFDNLGKMVCFHRHYELGDKHALSVENMQELIRRDDVLYLPLYLLDHSGITMRTGNFSDCDPGAWDSGQVGIIYIDFATIRKEYGKRITQAVKQKVYANLQTEVDIYDAYLTGAVVGYVVKDERGEETDSCWSFHIRSSHWQEDKKYVLGEARSAIDYTLRQRALEVAQVEAVFGLNPATP